MMFLCMNEAGINNKVYALMYVMEQCRMDIRNHALL